jgi:protoporphyrinogen oxidase
MSKPVERRVVIIGGGPAGLTAAFELCKARLASVVLEKEGVVGGLSKTLNYKGNRFDIGGHRFFTKVKAVEDTWREVLPGAEFMRCKRLSRIYYNKNYFHYPLRFSPAVLKLGLVNSLLICFSYLSARLFPHRDVETFEQWVTNRFGQRLYEIFFKTYTEKVWGIPCGEIRAEWAAQRIKDLSLVSALRSVFRKPSARGKNGIVKTLIEEFDYPQLGPGMMWEKMAGMIEREGGEIRRGAQVEKIQRSGDCVEAVEIQRGERRELVAGSHFISSMPLRELVQKFEPAAPREVIEAAANLHYRDFLIVLLIVDRAEVFPDNWIYIHDPEVKVGRIQNFKNWSAQMVADAGKTCLALEYFCFEGDGLWKMSDAGLIELGKRELEKLRLVKASDVCDGTVTRVQKAYPVYDSTYRSALAVVRNFLEGFENLQLVGRNGMHKYNNQDHSMLTAMLAVKNILGEHHDLWEVNADQEYLEEIRDETPDARDRARLASTQPFVPERIHSPTVVPLEPKI